MNEVIALMRERLNYDAETGVLTYSMQANVVRDCVDALRRRAAAIAAAKDE